MNERGGSSSHLDSPWRARLAVVANAGAGAAADADKVKASANGGRGRRDDLNATSTSTPTPRASVRRRSPALGRIAVTGQALSPRPTVAVRPPSRAKYFICRHLAKRKASLALQVQVEKSPKRHRARPLSIRVVSKLKKIRSDITQPIFKNRPRARLMVSKRVYPLPQKVISDPRQLELDRQDSDLQSAVNRVLGAKLLCVLKDPSLDMLAELPRDQLSADYLQSTYEYFHQRHVDNLRRVIAEQTREELPQPEKKKILIRGPEAEDMETEERPPSGSSSSSSREDIDRLSKDIDRLSRNIDNCRINEKVKPIITFTHVNSPEMKPSAKEAKVSSPLLEVPSLFLDLSAEMLRPPLGNM